MQGSFIALHEAIEAIGNHIAISDDEADGFRDLNETVSDSPFHEAARRASIKSFLQRSRAASVLRILLTGSSTHHPRWFELVAGTPIPDEQVRRGGVELLLLGERMEHNSTRIARGQSVDLMPLTAPALERLSNPYWQVGFDKGELACFLNAEGVAHNLQPPFEGQAKSGASDDVQRGAKESSASVVVNIVTKAGRPARLFKEIQEAQQRAGDQRCDAEEVWRHLVSMIDEEKYPRLCSLEDDQTIWCCAVPPHGRKFQYRKRSLLEYIDPDKKMKRDARKGKREAKKSAISASEGAKSS